MLWSKCGWDSTCWYDNFYSKQFNISSSMPSGSSDACHEINGMSTDITFYTSDGIAYSIQGMAVLVDINGDKKPNEITTDYSALKDTYYFGLGIDNITSGPFSSNPSAVLAVPPASGIIQNYDCKANPDNTEFCKFDTSEM
ncbi:MAG: hypothetical protein PHV37_09745 [Candidatus Gastranaerophilales bacterium]|nr:hypothetical protein [Candidatus Gastranaerophilales bacterium]